MPYRSKRYYRDIGFRHDHNKWLEEQAGGKRGVSKVVEKCIDRVMKQRDAVDRVDRLQDEVTELKASLQVSSQRLNTVTAFLEYQVWIGVGRNETAYDKWFEEFSQWQKDSEHA